MVDKDYDGLSTGQEMGKAGSIQRVDLESPRLEPDPHYLATWTRFRRYQRGYWAMVAIWFPATLVADALGSAQLAGLVCLCAMALIFWFTLVPYTFRCPRCDNRFSPPHKARLSATSCSHCRLPFGAPRDPDAMSKAG